MMDLYTDLTVAKREIYHRWNNASLKKEVESYLGKLPDCFHEAPKAVLFRNLMTPDHEFEQFIAQANSLNLAPLGLEFTADQFSTRNEDKICLLKMAIFEKRNQHHEAIFRYHKIADLKRNDNQKFSDIRLDTGGYLVDFHRHLLKKYAPNDLKCYDLSTWIAQHGAKSKAYYPFFLAFFLCHGVLLESFVTSDDEAVFEQEVVFPAFQAIEARFGFKPLIVQLLPSTSDNYWWCYPHDILNEEVS